MEKNARMPIVQKIAMRMRSGKNPRMNLFLSFTLAVRVCAVVLVGYVVRMMFIGSADVG